MPRPKLRNLRCHRVGKEWLADTGCDTCVSDKEVDEEDRAAAGQCCHSAADSFSAVNVIAAPGQRIRVTFESKPWRIFSKIGNKEEFTFKSHYHRAWKAFYHYY